MAKKATYSGDPSTSPLDAVRFYSRDTDIKKAFFSDSEINFVLTEYPNTKKAAASLLRVLASKFALVPDVKVGDVHKSGSQIAKQLREQAQELDDQAETLLTATAPAILKDRKRAYNRDPNLVEPQFRLGIGDDPELVQLNDSIDISEDFSGALRD